MQSNLTPEQDKAIQQLSKAFFRKSFLTGIKYGLVACAMTITTTILNLKFVGSADFQFIVTLINFVFALHMLMQENEDNRKKFFESVQKVLEKDPSKT